MIKVTLEVPDDILSLDQFIQTSIQAVNATVDDTLVDFNKSKATFSSENQFQFEVVKADGVTGGKIAGWVGTDNENYVRLNNGFDIPPVMNKLMAFRTGYDAKTAPGVIDAKGGGPSGRMIVRMSRGISRGPTHVPARQFDLAIRNKNITEFHKRVIGT